MAARHLRIIVSRPRAVEHKDSSPTRRGER
jgi:hypothetical protein